MPRPRVLVTDAEVLKTLAVVRALGDDFEVVTCSSRRGALASWSRFSNLHLRSPAGEDFSAWLVDTVREHSIKCLFCPQETTLVRAASVCQDLEDAGVRLSFPSTDVLDLAFDKAKTLIRAQEVGVLIPPTRILERWRDAEAAARDLGYPVVVKSRYSNFWTGNEWLVNQGPAYAEAPARLATALERMDRRQPPPILQKYIPGRGSAVFVLLDRNGRPCAHFAHQRLRDVRPTGSGSVLRRSIDTDTELLERSLALLDAMNWWGIAMIEYRTGRDTGDAYLMEVNGRFWGSLQLATDSGVNFPRLLHEVTLGRSPQPPEYRRGVVLRWWLGDLLGTLRALRGRPGGFPGRFPSRWSALRDFVGRQPKGCRNEVARANDPWPVVGEIVSALGRLR